MKIEKNDPIRRSNLPYPMELGSPSFFPIPVEKEKDILLNTSKLHAKQEYDRIMEQVEVLKKQADALVNRISISEMINQCVYLFKPVHGKMYYVYNNTFKNENWLSINSPNSWIALGQQHEYVVTVKLMGDSTWEEVIEDK